mgnify:CR=1 FL=1
MGKKIKLLECFLVLIPIKIIAIPELMFRRRIYMDLDRSGLDLCFDAWGRNSIFSSHIGSKIIFNF